MLWSLHLTGHSYLFNVSVETSGAEWTSAPLRIWPGVAYSSQGLPLRSPVACQAVAGPLPGGSIRTCELAAVEPTRTSMLIIAIQVQAWPVDDSHQEGHGLMQDLLGRLLEGSIQLGICLVGRRTNLETAPWLAGPVGQTTIGADVYRTIAAQMGLTQHLECAGGLVDRFDRLDGPEFLASAVDPVIRTFYERTADYTLDVWSEWHGPQQLLAKLLIRLVSRQIDQLNLPLSPLAIGRGMSSEIIHLTDPASGRLVYAGWLRRLLTNGSVVMAGLYGHCILPRHGQPCIKVVLPLPSGSATVILRPINQLDGSLMLTSAGRGFGDAGYYRLHRVADDAIRVVYAPLRETIHVYRSGVETLRTDQTFSFFGQPLLTLHYKIQPRSLAA